MKSSRRLSRSAVAREREPRGWRAPSAFEFPREPRSRQRILVLALLQDLSVYDRRVVLPLRCASRASEKRAAEGCSRHF